MRNYVLILAIGLFPFIALSQSQLDSIFLNEVTAARFDVVEIRNSSSIEFNPSDLFVTINGNTRFIGDLTSICSSPSDRIIEAQDQKGFVASGISPDGGEVVLHQRETILEANDILGYVVWGEVEPDFLDLAIEAGHWVGTETATAFFSSGSLEYDGDGNEPTDWLNQSAPSICDPNGTGCDVELDELEIENQFICMCDGLDESLANNGFSGFLEFVSGLLLDSTSTILFMTDFTGAQIDYFEAICIDEPLFFQVIAYNGEIENLEIGQNVHDINGCTEFSEIFPLESIMLDPFTTSLSINGEVMTPDSAIELCTIDGIPDDFDITTSSNDLTVFYLVQNGTILTEITSGTSFTTGLEAGTYDIVSFAYQGELGDSEGFFYLEPNIQGCFLLSDEVYGMEILEEGESGCFLSSIVENANVGKSYEMIVIDNSVRFDCDNSSVFKRGTLSLTTTAGQLLNTIQYDNLNNLQVDLTDYPKGLIYVVLESNNYISTEVITNF